jgi:hypothetical protein
MIANRRLLHAVLACSAVVLSAAAASEGATQDLTPYLMPDRAAEIALARSAASKAVSDAASVYVLTREGYVEAAKGSNGFACLVARSFEGSLDDTASWWNPRVRAPHCLNAAAVRTVLPEMQRRAALVMKGLPAAEVARGILEAYKNHELSAPENGAMAYMLSPDQYLLDSNPHWMPHVMFYYGGGHKGAEWGAGGPDATIIDSGTDASGMMVLLIPVPRWSDGTPAAHH